MDSPVNAVAGNSSLAGQMCRYCYPDNRITPKHYFTHMDHISIHAQQFFVLFLTFVQTSVSSQS